MRIDEHIRRTSLVLDVKGRVTAETAECFSETVAKRIEAGYVNLALNLENVTYIDSAGLGAIVHAYTSCQRRGGRMVLVHVAGKNKELLTITKLLTVFDCYDTVSQADRSFSDTPQAASA